MQSAQIANFKIFCIFLYHYVVLILSFPHSWSSFLQNPSAYHERHGRMAFLTEWEPYNEHPRANYAFVFGLTPIQAKLTSKRQRHHIRFSRAAHHPENALWNITARETRRRSIIIWKHIRRPTIASYSSNSTIFVSRFTLAHLISGEKFLVQHGMTTVLPLSSSQKN